MPIRYLLLRNLLLLTPLGVGANAGANAGATALATAVITAAAAAPATAPNIALASDASPKAMVDAHNFWRNAVGTPPLRWANDLAQGAQAWANHLAVKNGCEMEHSTAEARQKTGENLYWASPVRWSDGKVELQSVPATKVLKSWGGERDDYDYRHNTCLPGKQCGHYTQVVWRSTQEVGCAMQQCPDKSQVWVCRYRPTGNWVGERPY